MKLLRKLGRRFRREYRTDREDRYLRVAKIMGVSDSQIEHEMDHIREGRKRGHEAQRYIIVKDLLQVDTYLVYP